MEGRTRSQGSVIHDVVGALRAAPAMSAAGMLAMKEQFPTLRHGRPWRDKDLRDVETLKHLCGKPADDA